jgi:hypothetical protein
MTNMRENILRVSISTTILTCIQAKYKIEEKNQRHQTEKGLKTGVLII